MLLLTIAHKGEAQEFIKRAYTQPVDFHFPGIYRSGDDILLLTGDGSEQAILRISSVLTYFGTKIDRVLNMGIAGALSTQLQVNQIYGIRKVYHQSYLKQENYIMDCKETHSKMDCITVNNPVLNSKLSKDLSETAQIVDRELWGIGFTCRQYGKSFKSYKLISDFADKNTNTEKIKSNSSYFSKHLFDFYKKLSLTKESWSG
jgi:nucleoside phosphorylase